MTEIVDLSTIFDNHAEQLDEIVPVEGHWPEAVPLGDDVRSPAAWAYVYDTKTGVTAAVAEDAISGCAEVASEFNVLIPDTVYAQTVDRTFIVVKHVPRFESFSAGRKPADLNLVESFSKRYISSIPSRKYFLAGLYIEKRFGRSSVSDEDRRRHDFMVSDWAAKRLVAEIYGEKFTEEAPKSSKTFENPVYLIGIGNISF